MKTELQIAIKALSGDKNLPEEVVFEAVEAALASAYKRDTAPTANVEVKIDRETGDVRVFTIKSVTESVEDDAIEMTVAEARQHDRSAVVGDEIKIETTPQNAGRIAAQTAKQVVLQKLREAEREVVYEEFAAKEGDIVSGIITRVEPRHVLIDLGKSTEAIMPVTEQVRSEHYRQGQRIKVYLTRVMKTLQNIVNALDGERIDVVQWDPEESHFVANALSPAQVVSVEIDEPENTAKVVVPDRQLSLAIGKEGQNARLAAKLTNLRIDIKSQTAAEAERAAAAPPAAVAVEEPVAAAAARPLPVDREVVVAAGAPAEPEELRPAAELVATPPVAAAPTPVETGPKKIRFAEDLLGTARSSDTRGRKSRGKRDGVPEDDGGDTRGKPAKAKKAKPRLDEYVEDEFDVLEEFSGNLR